MIGTRFVLGLDEIDADDDRRGGTIRFKGPDVERSSTDLTEFVIEFEGVAFSGELKGLYGCLVVD